MSDVLDRAQPWLAGVALLAIPPGLLLAPTATWTALTVLGIAMITRIAIASAALIGARATIVRVTVGASIGPWLALADRQIATNEALELSAVAALLAVSAPLLTGRRPRRRDTTTSAHRQPA
jgi:hypothetical protein